MSRIGRLPVAIPAGVKVSVAENVENRKRTKGTLERALQQRWKSKLKMVM